MCETGFLLLCDSGRNGGTVIYLFGDDNGSENGSCGETFILNVVQNEVSGDSGKIRSDYGGFGIVQDVGVHDGASLYRIFRIFESECIITPENVCIDVLFGWMNDGQKILQWQKFLFLIYGKVLIYELFFDTIQIEPEGER